MARGFIRGTHHLTFCVGGAQEDYDFHVRVLGLKSVKKTVLFDGEIPIYHLYYGNRLGDPSTLLTAFPYRQAGWMGKRGTNQAKSLNLSVPRGLARLLGRPPRRVLDRARARERFGTERLFFRHPCGIEYQIVADPNPDDRAPYDALVPAEHAIRGAYGTTTSVRDPDPMTFFVTEGMGGELLSSEGKHQQFQIGDEQGYGRMLELVEEPDLPQGTWNFGEGTIHHQAFDVVSRREPAGGQGLDRRARLHRRLRVQGPRLLLLDVLPQPERPTRRDRLWDAAGLPDRRGPRTSSGRTCASRRTGRTAGRRSRSSSRSRRSRRWLVRAGFARRPWGLSAGHPARAGVATGPRVMDAARNRSQGRRAERGPHYAADSALVLIASNSAWVIAPLSSSSFARAISAVGLADVPAAWRT